MKTLLILFIILSTLTDGLYAVENNPSNHRPTKDIYNGQNPITKSNDELERIVIKFQNPLKNLDENMESYLQLLEIFNRFKSFDVEFTKTLLNKVKNQEALSGNELYLLRKTITTYYKINKKMLDFAKVYDFGGFKMSKTNVFGDNNQAAIKAHLIWLSGHLLVLNHLEEMHEILYENDGVFRRIVKSALVDKDSENSSADKTLNDIIKINSYSVDVGKSLKFSQQINLVMSISKELKKSLNADKSAKDLIDEIINNPTAKTLVRGKTEFALEHFTIQDILIEAFNKFSGWLSGLFGNAAGSVKWRKGHLYQNQTALEIARENLKPMDILLEKSPFILTDKFIPGYFGHTAVYLGTRAQLEAIGMWNHPDIIAYQKSIIAGKVILEAVRSGVHLTSLEDFMNIDEFMIMRKEDALNSETVLIQQISRGMEQIGKKYDFNFDITTLDKIVCSELVYIFFGNVRWPTLYRLGRPTITPDDIAEILFQKNTRFHDINIMISKEYHRINLENLDYIANELNYELRKNDGSPILDKIDDKNDPNNTYWKKEEKCYTVSDNSTKSGSFSNDLNSAAIRRACKITYKKFYYDEKNDL